VKPDLRSLISPVSDVNPDWPRVSVGDSPRVAAKVLSESGADAAAVYEGEALIGCVTAHGLLRVLADDLDSLTGLPRADRLRDWMTDKLTAGREVALVFIDLDDFKKVNAEQGHTAGDQLLRDVAGVLEGLVEAGDLCVRYGGDEFVIATTRDRTYAEALAVRAGSLAASFGFSGGRRKAARDDANLGSMVEELIRLASLDCMSKKGN
jgi:GGDEF domain-containing protein